jgi:hypothetical protein
LKEGAAERGLSPDNLTDLARDVAGTFKDKALGTSKAPSPSMVPDGVEPVDGGAR